MLDHVNELAIKRSQKINSTRYTRTIWEVDGITSNESLGKHNKLVISMVKIVPKGVEYLKLMGVR